MEVTLFKCEPLSTKLTRAACAQRHKRALREVSKLAKGQLHLAGGLVCARCPIGEAHARGETPDVPTVEVEPGSSRWTSPRSEERSDASVPSTPVGGRRAPRAAEPTSGGPEGPCDQPRASARAGNVQGPSGPPDRPRKSEVSMAAKRYQYGDRNLTLAEWAREADVVALGLTYFAIHDRLKRGWSVGRAVTEPPKPSKKSTPKAAPPPAPKPAKPRTNGQAIVERIELLDAKHDELTSPALVLEAAGYRVIARKTVPAGMLLIVETEAR